MGATALALACAGSGGAAVELSPVVDKFFAKRALRRFCSKHRILCLTFDDGPGTRLTPEILDLLGEAGAKASFFIIGDRVRGMESLVDRIAAEGHELGCHTMSHLHAWNAAPWRVVRDIADGYRALASWVASDGLFRPPFGKLVLQSWLHVRRRRAPFVWWTHDSGDTWRHVPSTPLIVDAINRVGGGVALLHDKDRPDATTGRFVVDTTRRLLAMAQTEGLRLMTAGAVLKEIAAKP
jgi:peptidoglycan-N-acetylglucosamine deacetylase